MPAWRLCPLARAAPLGAAVSGHSVATDMSGLSDGATGARYHRWEKGERCARCGLMRRVYVRQSRAVHWQAGTVAITEYSRDGVSWAAHRSVPACEVL